ARFLAQERMVWIGGTEYIDNGLFDGAIDFRDIILGPFARHLQAFKIEAGAVDDRASTACRLDGGIKHRVHKIPYETEFAEHSWWQAICLPPLAMRPRTKQPILNDCLH